jgi:amino acid permease
LQVNAIADRDKGLERRLSARQHSMIGIGGAIGTGLYDRRPDLTLFEASAL